MVHQENEAPVVGQEATEKAVLTLSGNDNYGRPRQRYANRIAAMDEAHFLEEAEQKIWLSAYANNNPRSDYHWQADACFDEAERRGKPELYKQAWEKASRTM